MPTSLRSLAPAIVTAVVLAACGGGNAASPLAKAPEYQPKDQTKCGVEKSQARPLIVEWDMNDRLDLETTVRKGLVAVRYVGCTMDVLERCIAPAKYNYIGGTTKQQNLEITNDDDLYANLPLGAVKLEGNLKRSGKLTVKMELVGRYEAERTSVRADELQGDCAGATHFIYGVSVGAFDFYEGGQAEVGAGASAGNLGAGGRSQASRVSIDHDGDPSTCEKAARSDKEPPEGCGALIRVEVVPLGEARQATPTCPGDTRWDGSECVAQRVVTQVQCPSGSSWDGSQCTARGAPGSEARVAPGPTMESQREPFVQACLKKVAAPDYCACGFEQFKEVFRDANLSQPADEARLARLAERTSAACATKLPEEPLRNSFVQACAAGEARKAGYCQCAWSAMRRTLPLPDFVGSFTGPRFDEAKRSMVKVCKGLYPIDAARAEFVRGCTKGDASRDTECDCKWRKVNARFTAEEIAASVADVRSVPGLDQCR